MPRHSRPTVFLAAIASLTIGVSAAIAGGTFQIDPVHSSVVYRVKHMDVSNFYGRFNDVSGSFTLDESDPTKSNIEVTIKTDSVDSGNGKRDEHLKSPSFFNAKEFPEISFKSTKVAAGDDGALRVTGNLTLHGISKEITVNLEKTGEATLERMGHRAGVETVFTIKRSDFGMDYMVNGGLGDEIKLMVAFEGAER